MTREVRKDAHRYRRANEATTAALRRIVHARRMEDIERRLAEYRVIDELLDAAVASGLQVEPVRVAA